MKVNFKNVYLMSLTRKKNVKLTSTEKVFIKQFEFLNFISF